MPESAVDGSWKGQTNGSHRPYLVIRDMFTIEECREIIRACERYSLSPGMTWDGEAYGVSQKRRWVSTAYVARDELTEWIYGRMDEVFVKTAGYWGLDVREVVEDLKYLVYRQNSHFRQWHTDVGRTYSNRRKISMSVELSSSTEYEGGEIQVFPLTSGHVAGPNRAAGTAIVFPSYRYHRVTAVTRGTRLALVNWISGPPLR